MVLVVNETVATPLAFVVLPPGSVPPVPVLVQVTVRPDVLTGLPYVSASWALMVTAVPATGL